MLGEAYSDLIYLRSRTQGKKNLHIVLLKKGGCEGGGGGG